MKRSKATSFFMFAFLAVLALSAGAAFYFYNQMSSSYLLIADGLEPKTHILDNYKYNKFQNGLIISLTILGSSACLLIMMLIPDEKPRMSREDIAYAHERSMDMGPSSISAEIGPSAGGFEMGPSAGDGPGEQVIDTIDIEGVEFDEIETEVSEGEDDVVYGSGEITNVAIVDFVHKHPDSALKFLFRKQLDGKTLTTDEEEIYHVWEQRGMTRGKVKAYILGMMEWDAFPKEPLYELWKKLRDHIFENFG